MNNPVNAPNVDSGSLPNIDINVPPVKPDWATISGLFLTMVLIAGAIMAGQSNASFFNVPAVMIVILGTITATVVSYTPAEIRRSLSVIKQSFARRTWVPSTLTINLLDMAVTAKKKGLLVLARYDQELSKDPFLFRAIQMSVDGFDADKIEYVLNTEIEAQGERQKRAISLVQRAAEVAPAMGLIGTLVGLVQMLADLENPEALGPAMAVAILTTLYGAVLGMVIMASLAGKMEKNAKDERLFKTLIMLGASGIARQDNPRQLEMILNAELPAVERIRYFD